MKNRFLTLSLTLLLAAFVSGPAFAQGGSSSITGTVVDQAGAVIPGATVTVTNPATEAQFNTVSGARGGFTIPALTVGTYTVTIALDGFKTVVLNNVVVTQGGPATVRAMLEVGSLSETVTVQGLSEVIQTQASAVSTRIDVNEIANLPLSSRNVLNFVTQLAGATTPGGNRSTIINGLTQSSISITLDGINVQDNTNTSGDGFFAIVIPRLDAIEEINVSSAAQGANSGGSGAVQIQFVTRSGSNTYTGSAYHYMQNDALNANDWFNIRDGVAKPELQQNQPGFRMGGPIVIPGLYDGHNQAFFFVNYEEFRQPRELTRDRTILTPEAQAGLFRYNSGGGVSTVDLAALAAANGAVSAFDPIVTQLLADIRAATAGTGTITDLADPNLQRFTYNAAQEQLQRYPTFRVDVNVSERNRLSGSVNYQRFSSDPDLLNGREPVFPGFPGFGTQTSTRLAVSTSLRSTLGANVVNELRVGGASAPVKFFDNLNVGMWNGPLANQGGFDLDIDTARIANPSGNATPSSRNAYNWLVENSVNWQAGNHGINFGGSFNEVRVWRRNQTLVPTIDFDIISGTSMDAVFGSSANFPGSTGTNRNDAEDLYAVLVGSVSSINGDARIDGGTGQYVYLGPSLQEGKLSDIAFWLQDAWRPRADLTVNLGLRYALQTPFTALNDSYSRSTLQDVWGISGNRPGCDQSNINPADCNIFSPGATTADAKAITEYQLLEKGQNLFNTDKNNWAPSVGVAWTPSSDSTGWFARFLGQPGDTVIRAGWSRSYQRNDMNDFTSRLDDNPGLIIQDVDRNDGNDNLLNGADMLLLRTPELLGPAPFPLTRNYPLTEAATQDVAWFDPNIQMAYADTWSAGWQRSLSRNMAMEVRYVGTRSRDLWFNYNINEVNILENGVFNEFQLAQQNLQANLAAGRGATFAYMGAGTGTSPLPIALAYFRGSPAAQAGNAALYTSSNFRSSTFVNELAIQNPDPFGYGNSLDAQGSRRANALAAGLPANFLVANPDKLGGAEIQGNGGFTNFDSLQLELRRRMSDGFQFQANYVYSVGYLADFFSFRVPRLQSLDTGGEGGVTHALKFNWLYELPFGQGKRFASNAGPVMDRIIGGWQIHGLGRFQTGEIVDFGNVRMVGFDENDLQDFFQLRIDDDMNVTYLPQDVIENTIKAYSISATSATGYSSLGVPEGRYFARASGPDCVETIAAGFGDCGTRVLEIDAPLFKNMDISIVKAVPITGRVRAEFRIEMLNAFNWVNYNPFAGVGGTTQTAFEATGLVGANQFRTVQLVSRVTW